MAAHARDAGVNRYTRFFLPSVLIIIWTLRDTYCGWCWEGKSLSSWNNGRPDCFNRRLRGLERAEEMGRWDKGCRTHVWVPGQGRTEPRVGFARGSPEASSELRRWGEARFCGALEVF